MTKVAQQIARLKELVENPGQNVAEVLRTFRNLFHLTHEGHNISPETAIWLNQTALLFLSPELWAVLVKLHLEAHSFYFVALNFIDVSDVLDDLSNEELLKNKLQSGAFNRLSRELLNLEPTGEEDQLKPVIVPNQKEVPLELTNVAVNYNSCHVQWNKPPSIENEQFGIVTGYKIQVQELDPTNFEVARAIEYDVGVVEEYIIGSLLPDSSYFVELVALTGEGIGARSAVMKVFTRSLPPGENYQCSECEYSCLSSHPSVWPSHVATHWKRGPFKCEYCHYYGTFEHLITNHVNNHHKKLRKTK